MTEAEILIRHNATWSMKPKLEHAAIYRNHYYFPRIFGVGKSFPFGAQAIGYIFSDPWISDFHNRERIENLSKSELFGMLSQTTFLLLLNVLVSLDIHPPYFIPLPVPRLKMENILEIYLNWHFGFSTSCSLYARQEIKVFKPSYLCSGEEKQHSSSFRL